MPFAPPAPSALRVIALVAAASLSAGGTAGAASPVAPGTEPAAATAAARAAAGAAEWLWPVTAPRVLARPYVAPATRYSAGHRGIDIAATEQDAAVIAPADGIVRFAGFVVDRPVLSIRHPGGIISSYEPVHSELVEGETVRKGQPLGRLLPGHCHSPCLHLGVRLHGEYLSPLAFLGGIPHSVLLPTRRLGGAAAREPA